MSLARLLVASLAALALAAPGAALAKAKGPKGHPATGADPATQDCAGCHADATPAVVKDWEGSRHGEAMVKCLVCHGDTGKAFTRAPPPARCTGCHAAQVASLPPAGKKGPAPSCFACHHPHTLAPAAGKASPHAR